MAVFYTHGTSEIPLPLFKRSRSCPAVHVNITLLQKCLALICLASVQNMRVPFYLSQTYMHLYNFQMNSNETYPFSLEQKHVFLGQIFYNYQMMKTHSD